MVRRDSLYDSASSDAVVGVGPGRALYIGRLDRVDWHAHGTPVLIAGMEGRFRLRVDGEPWLMYHAAVIPAGVPHILELGDNPLAALYVEPQIASLAGLARLGSDRATLASFREIYANRQSPSFAADALDDLLSFARTKDAPAIDQRVLRVVQFLAAHPGDVTALATIAATQGLSERPFREIFHRDMGVRFRRFRIWNRLRAAAEIVLGGRNLTEAALAAGFADSAHYTKQYHTMFGVTPSSVFRRVAKAR